MPGPLDTPTAAPDEKNDIRQMLKEHREWEMATPENAITLWQMVKKEVTNLAYYSAITAAWAGISLTAAISHPVGIGFTTAAIAMTTAALGAHGIYRSYNSLRAQLGAIKPNNKQWVDSYVAKAKTPFWPSLHRG